jgi:hypothetical protein
MTWLFYFLLFISAVFRALDQIIRWDRAWQSWLPGWVFDWDLGFLSIADAVHVYMGITQVAFGLAFLSYSLWNIPPRLPRSIRWLLLGGIIIIYYQVFNLFYHVIFIQSEFWRWPILAY